MQKERKTLQEWKVEPFAGGFERDVNTCRWEKTVKLNEWEGWWQKQVRKGDGKKAGCPCISWSGNAMRRYYKREIKRKGQVDAMFCKFLPRCFWQLVIKWHEHGLSKRINEKDINYANFQHTISTANKKKVRVHHTFSNIYTHAEEFL